jgi:ribose transport system substrate-binding protein
MLRIDFKGLFAGCVFALAASVMPLATADVAKADDAACEPHDIDIGGGKTIKGGCGQLKIAVTIAASNNVYLQANIQAAKDAAAKNGALLDVFDANWNPVNSFNQAQNVIDGGKYNAIATGAYDGNQYCTQLTKTAPEKNILVIIANSPACNRSTNEGDALWAPGTLAFVGGTQGRGPYRDWFYEIAQQNPGPQKVAVITGPDSIANTINTDLAIKDVQAKYPDFKIVGVVRTDYTVLQGNQKTLPLLQANPDLTIVISNYSDMTRGAVQAIKQAGMADKLKVYDFGGNKWAFEAVRRGQIVSTKTMTPYAEYYKAVDALAAAWRGEKVPRYIPLESVEITKGNIDKYKPEF